ncbi:hypothetical protein PGTUg99_029688 [Puccinia graminis f. sp. tritici]|uniref:Uncharacterized protein n=1 Tax=Puccinia graminis f. sp. tritici TaxID=56615 RepID=A0A5B0MCI8_PUCGR|nr:hypothetical protein PGTUg99_029688 [Puccinia graminis f. sp. tritici]
MRVARSGPSLHLHGANRCEVRGSHSDRYIGPQKIKRFCDSSVTSLGGKAHVLYLQPAFLYRSFLKFYNWKTFCIELSVNFGSASCGHMELEASLYFFNLSKTVSLCVEVDLQCFSVPDSELLSVKLNLEYLIFWGILVKLK